MLGLQDYGFVALPRDSIRCLPSYDGTNKIGASFETPCGRCLVTVYFSFFLLEKCLAKKVLHPVFDLVDQAERICGNDLVDETKHMGYVSR